MKRNGPHGATKLPGGAVAMGRPKKTTDRVLGPYERRDGRFGIVLRGPGKADQTGRDWRLKNSRLPIVPLWLMPEKR